MIRAFQWDLARQVERLPVLLDLLPRYAEWGYGQLYLHLEDAVDYPSLPGIARTDAYAWSDLEKLVATAARHGIQTVPIVNLLGHTQYLIKHPDYRDLNELSDPLSGDPMPIGQICPLLPGTLEVAEKLLADVAPLCTAGIVHVGLDESFHLGKHPLSRAEIEQIGLAAHFARYVGKLHHIATKRGLRMGIWADMLALLPEAIPQLPRGIAAYDWYYYPFGRQPRMELRNFATYDLAPALAAQGIGYWACPMNGAFRYEPAPVYGERLANIVSWWRRAKATQAEGLLVTSWEAYRLALETTTLVDAAAASLWLDADAPEDPAGLLARGLRRLHGLAAARARTAAGQLLAGDTHAFAGYHRWEINTRWDTVAARRESPAPFAREARRLARLEAAPPVPGSRAQVATIRFQRYLAERDAFVRSAGLALARMRRAGVKSQTANTKAQIESALAACDVFETELRAGRTAAKAMWATSRDPRAFAAGHNARILDDDAKRLKAWRVWLKAAARNPGRLPTASPMGGAWQLQFTVHNFAPALQKVIVEQRHADGSWHEVHGRFLIEFRAAAARPKARLQREFSCPVDDPAAPLRIALRGLGQVRVGHIALTDGVTELRPSNLTPAARPLLGTPAPQSGWPVLDWANNAGELELTFPQPEKD